MLGACIPEVAVGPALHTIRGKAAREGHFEDAARVLPPVIPRCRAPGSEGFKAVQDLADTGHLLPTKATPSCGQRSSRRARRGERGSSVQRSFCVVRSGTPRATKVRSESLLRESWSDWHSRRLTRCTGSTKSLRCSLESYAMNTRRRHSRRCTEWIGRHIDRTCAGLILRRALQFVIRPLAIKPDRRSSSQIVHLPSLRSQRVDRIRHGGFAGRDSTEKEANGRRRCDREEQGIGGENGLPAGCPGDNKSHRDPEEGAG